VSTSLRQLRILVTGASGFIGSRVAARLHGDGAYVVGLDRPGTDPWRLQALAPTVSQVSADITDSTLDARVAALGTFDAAIHLAAEGVHATDARPEEVVRANVEGSARVLAAVARAGAQRFVYCGSCFEYGSGSAWREDAVLHPETVYAASKLAGWVVTRSLGLELGVSTVSLRPFTAYGPFEPPQRLVPRVVLGALRSETIQLTGGEQTRDWVYIDDVAAAFASALSEDGLDGDVFNVCTGSEASVRDLTDLVLELCGSDRTAELGALPYREHEYWRLSGDPQRATIKLRWSATTSLRDGLTATIAWFRAHADRFGAYRRYEHV
jgi:nucleoside-diphosphate-sugar epimerase